MTDEQAAWEALIIEGATLTAERENEADSHCGAYGTSKPAEYVEQTRELYETIGKAYAAYVFKRTFTTGEAVRYSRYGMNFDAVVINPDDEGWVEIRLSDETTATVRPSRLTSVER